MNSCNYNPLYIYIYLYFKTTNKPIHNRSREILIWFLFKDIFCRVPRDDRLDRNFCPLMNVYITNRAIEIVDLPIKNADVQ